MSEYSIYHISDPGCKYMPDIYIDHIKSKSANNIYTESLQ